MYAAFHCKRLTQPPLVGEFSQATLERLARRSPLFPAPLMSAFPQAVQIPGEKQHYFLLLRFGRHLLLFDLQI